MMKNAWKVLRMLPPARRTIHSERKKSHFKYVKDRIQWIILSLCSYHCFCSRWSRFVWLYSWLFLIISGIFVIEIWDTTKFKINLYFSNMRTLFVCLFKAQNNCSGEELGYSSLSVSIYNKNYNRRSYCYRSKPCCGSVKAILHSRIRHISILLCTRVSVDIHYSKGTCITFNFKKRFLKATSYN